MQNIKSIPGFEGLYLAHELGFIISCAKSWIGGKGNCIKRSKPQTCLKPAIDKDGYLKVTLMKDRKPHYFRVPRLVCMAFHENPNNLPQVNHKDGNKRNNSAGNLEWITDKGNKRHAWDTGLKTPSPQKVGGQNEKAKLTDEQAEEIRNSSKSQRALAAEYGVHHAVIFGIKKGTRYPKKLD